MKRKTEMDGSGEADYRAVLNRIETKKSKNLSGKE